MHIYFANSEVKGYQKLSNLQITTLETLDFFLNLSTDASKSAKSH